MDVGRRQALKLLAALPLTGSAGALLAARPARALSGPLSLRPVAATDAPALQAIMTSCVENGDAFFGQCGTWPLSWAEEFTQQHPHSPVLAAQGEPLAFFQIPTIKPAPASLPSGASPADAERAAMRESRRTTFRVTAAGIRFDVLAPADAVVMFRTMLYYAFSTARQLGYEAVEALAPWEQHPLMPRKWTDYPGCTLFEPVARDQAGGHDVYFLRWQLEAAIAALADEERFDVA